ncbi:hypothetical protein DUI87_32484 [Hirundo rustica rustica]|uniref:Uncharacterized protein n=1 Tax=Hirundo rustica rustica TaxID=333673 RepID=A0A3M0IRU4_HIRRU|nr:hypothetical protein DUI87_32484 [Hirundo rustica rustica]
MAAAGGGGAAVAAPPRGIRAWLRSAFRFATDSNDFRGSEPGRGSGWGRDRGRDRNSGGPQPQITYAMSCMAWKAVQLFQGKPRQTEDDSESLCTPWSCSWEMAEIFCVTHVFTPAGII